MFYLSKIVWAVFQPSSFIAILLMGGLFLALSRRRSGFFILGLGVGLYLLCCFAPIGDWLLDPLERQAVIGASEPIEGAAGIIVLGGAVAGIGDGADEEHVLLNDSGDRMVEAVRLALQYPDLPVIFSGGSADLLPEYGAQPEADMAEKFFATFKIAPPRLRLERRSRNTLENAVFTAEMLHPRSDQRWVLVTSAFHMPRARALFEAHGFHIVPRPGDFRVFSNEDIWQLFAGTSTRLRKVDIGAKEWVGLFVSWLRGDIAWPGVEQPIAIKSAQAGSATP